MLVLVLSLVVGVQEGWLGQDPWAGDPVYPTTIAGWRGERPGERAPPLSWTALEVRWDSAMWRWTLARRSGAVDAGPAPHAELEAAFDALAEELEPRAILWMLAHRSGTPEERREGRRRDFMRLRTVEDARWAARGMLLLAADTEGLERERVLAWLDPWTSADRPAEARAAALLATARLTRGEAPARADELVWRAIQVFADGEERRDGEPSAAELRALAARFLEALRHAERAHANEGFVWNRDGTRFPGAVPAPDPAATWRPAVELLASRGVPAARLHLVRTTSGAGAHGRAVLARELAALCASDLEPEELDELATHLDWLVIALGADAVEAAARALAARAGPEAERSLRAAVARGRALLPAPTTSPDAR